MLVICAALPVSSGPDGARRSGVTPPSGYVHPSERCPSVKPASTPTIIAAQSQTPRIRRQPTSSPCNSTTTTQITPLLRHCQCQRIRTRDNTSIPAKSEYLNRQRTTHLREGPRIQREHTFHNEAANNQATRLDPLPPPATPSAADSRGGCNTCYALSSSSRRCLGVSQFSVLRGRLLSWSAMASRSASVRGDRSVPLGMYWRRSPFVFSFVPRCQGECGSQKYTSRPSCEPILRCWASSLPWF